MTLGSEKPLRHHLGVSSNQLLMASSKLKGLERKDAMID